MDHAAQFTAMARESTDFFVFYWEFFFRLAIPSPYDDETLKSLFWIGVNFHHPVDLPDTTGLIFEGSHHPVSGERPSPIQDPARPRAEVTVENARETPADAEGPPAAQVSQSPWTKGQSSPSRRK